MGEAAEVRGTGVEVRPTRARRRVLIRDQRDDGRYFRATWHPERRMFVVSTWHDEVCTGAVRLPVEAAGDLASLILDGLTDTVAEPRRPAATVGALSRAERRIRAWRRRRRRPQS